VNPEPTSHREAPEFTEREPFRQVLENTRFEAQLVYEARVLKILFLDVSSEADG